MDMLCSYAELMQASALASFVNQQLKSHKCAPNKHGSHNSSELLWWPVPEQQADDQSSQSLWTSIRNRLQAMPQAPSRNARRTLGSLRTQDWDRPAEPKRPSLPGDGCVGGGRMSVCKFRRSVFPMEQYYSLCQHFSGVGWCLCLQHTTLGRKRKAGVLSEWSHLKESSAGIACDRSPLGQTSAWKMIECKPTPFLLTICGTFWLVEKPPPSKPVLPSKDPPTPQHTR